MDDLIECLLELLFDIGEAAAQSKESPTWLRRLLWGLFIVFCTAVILALIVFGIRILPENPIPGILLLAAGLLFLILGLVRLLKRRKSKAEAALEPSCAHKPDRS